MKYLFNLFILGILVNSCCKEGIDCAPNCPLPDGTYCGQNYINIDEQCVCPEGYVEINNNCSDSSVFENSYLLDLDCECYGVINFGINNGFSFFINLKDGSNHGGNFGYQGDSTNFTAYLNEGKLDCDRSDTIFTFPVFKGKQVGDTLHLTVYTVENPFWNTPIDSCKYVIAKI